MTTREHLLDILERLIVLQDSLGTEAFSRACHQARKAIASVALQEAERTSGSTTSSQQVQLVNHNQTE